MQHEVLHLNRFFPELGEDSRDPILTLYLPDNLEPLDRLEQRRPCMLICPGGGYRSVSPREAEPVAVHFLPEGFNVFVLTYSTAPHPFPSQLREVAAAMELIHRNQAQWHCDTDRIAIMGFSAGGHLAAHYTNAYDCPEVRELFPDSKPVAASVLCYPVISIDPTFRHGGSFKNLTGCDLLEEAALQRFSCERLVSPRTPPTFLWHTAADKSVPVKNSLVYAQALAENGVPFEYHVYPNGGHGLSTADIHTNKAVNPMAAYVKDWLGALKQWLTLIFPMQ